MLSVVIAKSPSSVILSEAKNPDRDPSAPPQDDISCQIALPLRGSQ